MSAEFPTTSEEIDDSSPDVAGVTRKLGETTGSYDLVLSGVVLGLGGFFVDRWLGTTPVFMLIFTLLGVAGSAISIYYRYRHQISQLQAEALAMRAVVDRRRAGGPSGQASVPGS